MRARWLVVALALAGAIALALSVWGGRWWAVGDVGIGPFGSSHCFGGECRRATLGWLGGSDRWMRTGMGAGAGCLIAMLVLVIVAAGAAARRTPRLAAKTALVALTTAVVTGGLFVAQFPGGVEGAAPGRGLALFVVGAIAGIAAAVAVLRARPAAVPA